MESAILKQEEEANNNKPCNVPAGRSSAGSPAKIVGQSSGESTGRLLPFGSARVHAAEKSVEAAILEQEDVDFWPEVGALGADIDVSLGAEQGGTTKQMGLEEGEDPMFYSSFELTKQSGESPGKGVSNAASTAVPSDLTNLTNFNALDRTNPVVLSEDALQEGIKKWSPARGATCAPPAAGIPSSPTSTCRTNCDCALIIFNLKDLIKQARGISRSTVLGSSTAFPNTSTTEGDLTRT